MFQSGEFCFAVEEQGQLELSERIGLVQERGFYLILLCDIQTQESLHHRTKEQPNILW